MKKICSECKTENETYFLFCKNCGNPLGNEQNFEEPTINRGLQESNTQNANSSSCDASINQEDSSTEPTTVAGIDKGDFITFIGENGNKIYSKFAKMEYSDSKVSWCWPAAILQFCVGFFGSAIWFFYRKMYKVAVILLALGFIFTAATTFLTYENQILEGQNFLNNFSDILDEFESGNVEAQENIFEDIQNAPGGNNAIIKAGIAEIIELIETFGGTAIVGMFSMYFYKNTCVKKITEFKKREVDSKYYSYCLSLVGGTSGVMLTLGIIITVLITTVIDSIVILPLLFN